MLLLLLAAPFLALASSQMLTAQTLPQVVCGNLPGCGQGIENVLFTGTLPVVVSLMIQLAAGGAVIAIVVAGSELLLTGSEEGATTARKAVLYALGGLGLAIAAAPIVSFVSTENYGQVNPQNFLFGPGGLLTSIIRIILVLFNTAFVIVIIFTGFQMVLAGGQSDKFKTASTRIKWAIIGAVLVNLARAIVQATLNLEL